MQLNKYEGYMNENIKTVILEQNIGQINETLKRMEQTIQRLDHDMKTGFQAVDNKFQIVNDRIWSNSIWLLSMIVGSTIGLAYLMAHGFHWF